MKKLYYPCLDPLSVGLSGCLWVARTLVLLRKLRTLWLKDPAFVSMCTFEWVSEKAFTVCSASTRRFSHRALLITPLSSSMKRVNISKQYVLVIKPRQRYVFSMLLNFR